MVVAAIGVRPTSLQATRVEGVKFSAIIRFNEDQSIAVEKLCQLAAASRNRFFICHIRLSKSPSTR
jgi:hypothetical protein